MENQQYTPDFSGQATPSEAENSAQAQNPAAQTPPDNGQYAAQNPYGQNGYGYTQTPPYGYPLYGQTPRGGYSPQYTPPPYGQTPYYGQGGYAGAPYSGYPQMPTDPNLQKKKAENRALRTMSMAHGFSVLGFSGLAYAVSACLALIPGFRAGYMGNMLFQEAVNAAFSLIIIFVPFFLSYLFQKKRGLTKDLPLGTPNDGKAAILLIFIGVACCVAASYASGILLSVIEELFGITFTMPESDAVYNTVPMFLLGVLGTAVVPAFVEEFAIRGVVFQPMRKYGEKFAIVMSALVFALMHGNMMQIPFAFVAGVAIAYAVTVTGSMWVGVAIHFLNNFISVLMQTAVDTLPDTQENIVLLGIVALVFSLGIASLVLYLKNYAREPLAKGSLLLSNGEKAKAYLCTVPMILAGISLLVETAQYIEF